MSILDDAIREHLELKRAHGADSAELKKLEDEAFGPPGRPDEVDPLAEAPTEFLASEGAEEEGGGRRVPNIADLQEAPPPREEAPSAEAQSEAEEADPPAPVEEEPAMEHEAVPEAEEAVAEPEAGHSTGEREAIAEQPTEFFDVEADMESAETASPSDEELVDAELAEPRLAPVDPLAGIDPSPEEAEIAEPPAAEEEEDEDDFFSEQRLSEELSQALDAPIADEETAPPTEERAAVPPAEDSHVAEYEDGEDEGYEDDEEYEDDHEDPPPPAHAADDHEDVLEDTPDFLEDTPEDDDLWFEQKPPKDFDFDD